MIVQIVFLDIVIEIVVVALLALLYMRIYQTPTISFSETTRNEKEDRGVERGGVSSAAKDKRIYLPNRA